MSQENVTGKQPLIRHVNRQQPSWHAVDVERLIGEDHPARAIWTLVGRPTMIWQILASGAGARALADILETLSRERRGFEARGKQIAHDVIGEEFHAAIGMMDDEEFASAQQFVTYNEGPNGVVAGSPSSVADDVGVAFGQAGVFGGIKARVHAGENGEAARGRQSEFAPLTEIGAVFLIGFEDFRQYLAHGDFL